MGVYTAEDFQSSYTQCDANSVLELLECLDLCVQVEYILFYGIIILIMSIYYVFIVIVMNYV